MIFIGLGIDLVEVQRVRALLAKAPEDFLAGNLTAGERDAGGEIADPAPYYAGRWAAKEAVAKALGLGMSDGITPQDIEVQNTGSGKPIVILSGRALEIAQNAGVTHWMLSISRTEAFAIANAIALG